MAKSEETIKQEIKDHIASRGGKYSDWYVGIAADPEQRVYEDHRVDEYLDKFIWRWAENDVVARKIERYFIDQLGTDGGPGGGSKDTRCVYAYKKSTRTNP